MPVVRHTDKKLLSPRRREKKVRRTTVVYICLPIDATIDTTKQRNGGVRLTMKAWISIDMEGISGIVDREQLLPEGRLYQASRALMVEDLLSVMEGLRSRGVDTVVVNDSHDGMLNLPWDQLPPDLRVILGANKPGSMVEGSRGADFALLVGYHAMAGTSAAVMDHTYSGEIRRVRLNGMAVGETGINAAAIGEWGVPVILVTGDRAVGEEAKALLPWVKTAVVKEAVSRRSAVLISREETRTILRQAVESALDDGFLAGNAHPWQLPPPVSLEVELMTTDMADRAMYCPYMERADGVTVRQTFPSVAEAFRGFYTVMALAAGRPLY